MIHPQCRGVKRFEISMLDPGTGSFRWKDAERRRERITRNPNLWSLTSSCFCIDFQNILSSCGQHLSRDVRWSQGSEYVAILLIPHDCIQKRDPRSALSVPKCFTQRHKYKNNDLCCKHFTEDAQILYICVHTHIYAISLFYYIYYL